MTPHKFENKLRNEAESFIKKMLQAGIDVEPYVLTFSDYLVKIAIQDKGKITIYYRAQIDAFALALHELHDTNLQSMIELCWDDEATEALEYPVRHKRSIYQAYIDGSYHNGRVGYGVTILKHNEEIERILGQVTQHIELRQVSGELQAVTEVLKWCEQNDVHEIDIFYDYAGVEQWVTGAWQANNQVTQDYVNFVQSSNVRINWRKVKSHTGDFWNDLADKLSQLF